MWRVQALIRGEMVAAPSRVLLAILVRALQDIKRIQNRGQHRCRIAQLGEIEGGIFHMLC